MKRSLLQLNSIQGNPRRDTARAPTLTIQSKLLPPLEHRVDFLSGQLEVHLGNHQEFVDIFVTRTEFLHISWIIRVIVAI